MALVSARRAAHELKRLPTRLQGKHRVNDKGRGVLGFIDVGSAGHLPDPWDTHAYLIRSLLAFEPRDPRASAPDITSLDVAVWERDEERDFYVNAASHGSSLFEHNFDYVRDNFETLSKRGSAEMADTWFERSKLDRVERVSCRALDGILGEIDGSYDFLKVDTQGAEYQVLKGADRFLRGRCQGLHLELLTVPMYTGITLMPEIIEWLGEEYGFQLVHQSPAFGTFDCAHDCLFVKPGNSPVHDAIRFAYRLRSGRAANGG